MPAAHSSAIHMKRILVLILLVASAAGDSLRAQTSAIDWKVIETETLRHFQALVRIDTSNPPGNETRALEYVKQLLDQ
jgi:Ni/Co efflux regulator RcnB